MTEILGIDIGGSGIKGAPVNITTGELTQERKRIPTPEPSAPEPVAEVVAEIARHFDWSGPVGCTYPGVVKEGVTHTAANVDKGWIGLDGRALLAEKTGRPVALLNDADAAGIAEMRLGAGKGEDGLVFMLTFGTGIGTALFINGLLVPNTELGHLEIEGKEGEHRASDKVRKDEDLSWKSWAKRVNEYLAALDALFWPDLFIIGGGVSKEKRWAKFSPFLEARPRIVPARFRNEAGMVGAALVAKDLA